MTTRPDNQSARRALTSAKPVSVHRAFVYSASLPGLGEIYAGNRIRGLVTAVLFSIAVVWFCVTFFQIVNGLIDPFMARLQGHGRVAQVQLPWFGLAASFGSMYILWLWAVMLAVDSARAVRLRGGMPAQASVVWAVILSWVCPGAGNVYAGSKRYGYMLFAANLIGMVVLVPAYLQLFHDLSDLTRSGRMSPANPYLIIDSIHATMVRLTYSFGKQYQSAILLMAIAGTIAELSRDALRSDDCWSRPSLAHGLGLLVLGWLCPGCGQHLQKRYSTGWSLLTAYIGSRCLIGVLLGFGAVDIGTADRLEWVSIAIQWGAMLESVWHMRREPAARRS